MNKIDFCMLSLAFIVLLNGGCSSKHLPERCVCQCLIFPTTDFEGCYLIEVDKDGYITTSVGEKADSVTHAVLNDIHISTQHIRLLKNTCERETKLLGKDEFLKLQQQISKLEGVSIDNIFLESWENDSWAVILLTEEKQYIFPYWDCNNSSIEELVKSLVRGSPINIELR